MGTDYLPYLTMTTPSILSETNILSWKLEKSKQQEDVKPDR